MTNPSNTGSTITDKTFTMNAGENGSENLR